MELEPIWWIAAFIAQMIWEHFLGKTMPGSSIGWLKVGIMKLFKR